jgi:hypothetical protein
VSSTAGERRPRWQPRHGPTDREHPGRRDETTGIQHRTGALPHRVITLAHHTTVEGLGLYFSKGAAPVGDNNPFLERCIQASDE